MGTCSVDLRAQNFNGGGQREKLEILAELSELAGQCRARSAKPVDPGSGIRRARPWREFRELAGRPLFDQLLAIVRHGPPSEVREQAGDIMVLLEHPCAIGRLLELYERRGDTVNESPPLAIYRDLGLIGTAGAARALISLWGTRWSADMAGALGMCKCSAAQNFLLRQAAEHDNSYVRQMCIAHIQAPLTKEKTDLFIDRLRNGSCDERFVAILKVQELRVVAAVETLVSMRGKIGDEILVKFIDEVLPVLCGAKSGARQRKPALKPAC